MDIDETRDLLLHAAEVLRCHAADSAVPFGIDCGCADVAQRLDRLRASLLARHRDGERLDWLEHCNSQKRGDVPILPPICGYSVRQYIDRQLADANTPCAAGPSPERASK